MSPERRCIRSWGRTSGRRPPGRSSVATARSGLRTAPGTATPDLASSGSSAATSGAIPSRSAQCARRHRLRAGCRLSCGSDGHTPHRPSHVSSHDDQVLDADCTAGATSNSTPSCSRIGATDGRQHGRSRRSAAGIRRLFRRRSDDFAARWAAFRFPALFHLTFHPRCHRSDSGSVSTPKTLRRRCATAAQISALRAETGATPSPSRQIGSIAYAGAYARHGVAPVSARADSRT